MSAAQANRPEATGTHSPAGQSRAAVVHDLGYAPYVGPRTAHAARFWIIARNVFAVGWRAGWRVRLPIVASVGGIIASVIAMYVLRNEVSELVRMQGLAIPRADEVVFYSTHFYFGFVGFVLALGVGCPAIADDLRLGAFQFYFSRPLRPRDYLTGKLLGVLMVVGLPLFAGPVILSLARVLLAGDLDSIPAALPIIPKAVLLGLVGTAATALPAVAFGALMQKRGPAQALYALYYLLLSSIAVGLSDQMQLPYLRLFSAPADMEIVGRALFGFDPGKGEPPVWSAAAAIVAIGVLAAYAIWSRVRKAETAALGGG